MDWIVDWITTELTVELKLCFTSLNCVTRSMVSGIAKNSM